MIAPSGNGFALAYTDLAQQDQLPQILEGGQPTGFHWAMLNVPVSLSVAIDGTELTADLADATAGIAFQQVYQGVCNPARTDFNECWLYEHYSSGQEGLSGRIQLKVEGAMAQGRIDIEWAGYTDRFGDPIQYHQHGTSVSINVPVSIVNKDGQL